MAMDLNRSPYYDDFDSSKNYSKILAIPGRVVQAREFTQMQSILKDQIQQLGDAVLANGTVVSGCPLSVNDDGSRVVVTIGAGKIYLDGAVRAVNESTVEISGSGIEYICAKVVSDIVTEETDTSLNDLVQNNDNYGKPGAHRLRERVQFLSIQSSEGDTSAISNQNAAKVFTLTNGSILTSNSTPTVTTISSTTSTGDIAETLARRTYDENGSYSIEGLSLVDRHEYDSEGIILTVTPGKAYVNGYEVEKVTNSTIHLNYESGFLKRYNESLEFKTGTLEYSLTNIPVKSILEVDGTVEVAEIAVKRGNHKGATATTDDLSQFTLDGSENGEHIENVEDVLDCYTKNQGVIDKHYTGENAPVLTNDSLDWSDVSSPPAVGTTYYIKIRYRRTYIIGTDVQLKHFYENGVYESRIQFIKAENYPVNKTRFQVTYEYYKARTDLITLSQDGNFKVLKGKPNSLKKTVAPANNDKTLMTLGSVIIMPGYYSEECPEYFRNLTVTNENNTRISQKEIYRMKSRLDNLEYNTAMTDLDKEAMEGESASLLRGILTDGFIGFTKADVSADEFSASMDVDSGELTLAMDSYEVTPTVSSSSSVKVFPKNGTALPVTNPQGYPYLANYTEAQALFQSQATSAFKVNPYAAYDPMSLLEISPALDNWIEEETVYVQGNTITQSATLYRWWYHNSAANQRAGGYWQGKVWVDIEEQKALWTAMTGHDGSKLGWSNYNGTQTKSTTDFIYDQLVTFMRQIDITVTGSNYRANADQLVCYFDDKPVNLTPLSGTTAGTAYKYPKDNKTYTTVKANAAGEFSAKFKVPANTPCGTVSVTVKNNLDAGGTATYVAQGHKQIKRVTTQTVKVHVTAVDPLAQSFQFSEDTTLTKVGLFFATKDTSKNCLLQIRNMVNGFPGTDVYDEVIIKASSVKVSSTGATETVVYLNRPVYCQANTQYCFVILSDSNAYEMWIATIGEKNISTQNTVVSQPYGAGLMFSSSNAMTWSEHQTSDLKFKLYKAVFQGTGILSYNTATFSSNISRILIAAQSTDFKNDGIQWYYKTFTDKHLPSDEDFVPIEPYEDVDLGVSTKSIQFRAELTATSGKSTSPILDTGSILVKGFSNKLSGQYESRTVYDFDNPFNKIAISLEAATPAGTSFDVYYQTELYGEWQKATLVSGYPVQVDKDFYKYSYLDSCTSSTYYRVRIVLNTTNSVNRPRIRKLINIMRNE